jgi:hypothetical protein
VHARNADGFNKMLACTRIILGTGRESHHCHDLVKASILDQSAPPSTIESLFKAVGDVGVVAFQAGASYQKVSRLDPARGGEQCAPPSSAA